MLRFDDFMASALYGPDGFYTAIGQAGRRGDFITSPEVGPLFGAVLARALDAWWDDRGRPDDFRVYECGAGPGTLARAVLAARPACLAAPDRYVAVEVSEVQRAQHPAGVSSVECLPDGRLRGVVVANELLDNLPFRLAVFDGGWREAHVVEARDGWAEVLQPLPGERAYLPANAPHGARAPLQDQAAAWVDDVLGRLHGELVVFDYAVARTAQCALRPWREWLRTYVGHERGEHYLRNAGRQDITADVCVDQLPEPDAVRTQAQFLQLWGIDELVEEGRALWAAQASQPGLEAMKGRSRLREAEALLEPTGLGGFSCLTWSRM